MKLKKILEVYIVFFSNSVKVLESLAEERPIYFLIP